MPVIGRGRGKFVPKGKLFSSDVSLTTRDPPPSHGLGGTNGNNSGNMWSNGDSNENGATTTDAWGNVHNDTNTDRFADPSKEVKIKFHVLNTNVSRIIGKFGASIRTIMAESSATINVDKTSSDEIKTEVVVEGSKLNCDHAKRMIDEICMKFGGMYEEEGGSSNGGGGFRGEASDGPSSNEDIWIPEDKCGRVIGRGGIKIKEIQNDTGCNVKVHDRDTAEDCKVMVTLTGSDSQRAKAKGIIESLTADRGGGGGGGFSMPSDAEPLDIWVESGRLGRVVGKGGSKIREIQETFSVRVDIKKDEIKDDDTKVVLTGSPSNTQQAKEFIDDLTERSSKPDSSSFGGGNGDSWDVPAPAASGGDSANWGAAASGRESSGWGPAPTGGDSSGWGQVSDMSW